MVGGPPSRSSLRAGHFPLVTNECPGPRGQWVRNKLHSRWASRVLRAEAEAWKRPSYLTRNYTLRRRGGRGAGDGGGAGGGPHSSRGGARSCHPTPAGSPRVPASGRPGQRGQPRTCVRACVRASPRGGAAGGPRAARRAGQRARAASSRRDPPARARRMVRPGPRLIVLASRRPKMAAALEAPGL